MRTRPRCTKADDGFDFLSFNIRRHHKAGGAKVLTRPSRDAMKKMRRRIADELRALRGASPEEVIRVMNPIIRGQANYYRSGASSRSFQALDNHLWPHLREWALRRHLRKPRKWVMSRYFGPFNPARRNNWVFGDRQTGAYLHHYAWTKIVRHVPVAGTNPMTLRSSSIGTIGDVNVNHRRWPSLGSVTYVCNTDYAPCAMEPGLARPAV